MKIDHVNPSQFKLDSIDRIKHVNPKCQYLYDKNENKKVFRVKPFLLLIALFRNEAFGQCELYGSHIVQVTSNSLVLILSQINM